MDISHFACIIYCRVFSQNRTKFNLEDKLSPVYNMASSGLKKMLDLIILYTHKSVSDLGGSSKYSKFYEYIIL